MGKKERKRVSLLVSLLQFTSFINYTHLSQDRACTTVATLSTHGTDSCSNFSPSFSQTQFRFFRELLFSQRQPDRRRNLLTTLLSSGARKRRKLRRIYTNQVLLFLFLHLLLPLSFLLPDSFVVYPSRMLYKLNAMEESM